MTEPEEEGGRRTRCWSSLLSFIPSLKRKQKEKTLASLHRRRSWLSEESFFVLSALSKSNPLFPVFFLARRPSSIEFFLLAVVLSPSSSSRRPLEGKTDGAFVHQTMDKWPSSNLMGSPVKKIMLCSSEKEIFSVEEQVMVQHSVIINNMIEDGSYNHEESKIPLDCVDSKTLKKVIDYCTHHTHHQNDNQEDLEAWDAQFLNVDSNGLYDLLMAANYLEIRDLLDLIYRSIKNMIKGKKIDEIRRIFNIKDHGFTPEEEEQNRKEYPHFY
ncbi:SKP1-like protein 11 isoform X3 [Arachis ipaensis]|uniref:SKP1-like protein 11 isoform X3 n=1 Tax=Arachis ipaensis TaxID=130454 RepID=UPI000A2AFB18|nr:SKP1-like protein 11 isoform X3 [Arachis ipaensis]